MKKLFVVAGRSGGHLLPALQVAKKWHSDKGGKVILFTTSTQLDEIIAHQHPFLHRVVYLPLQNVPGKHLFQYPLFAAQLMYSLISSLYFVLFARPERVITTGGYIAFPVVIVARLFRIPVVLYEVNVKPGKAVAWLARFASSIHIAFASTKEHFKPSIARKCILDAYPLRFSVDDKSGDKHMIIEKINTERPAEIPFDFNKKTIFIIGGSQGSEFINSSIRIWLENRQDLWKSLQIIHQIGIKDDHDWAGWYKSRSIPALTFAYHHDVKEFYLLCDLVICRAGAGTLFEAEFFGKPSIIIPLKTVAQNHQVINAHEMIQRNPSLFVVLDQDEMRKNATLFENQISQFLAVS